MGEREKFNPPDSEQRRNYKYALLLPYFGELPPSVVEAMLDLDLIQKDQMGNHIASLYEIRLKAGEVDEEIDKSLHLRKELEGIFLGFKIVRSNSKDPDTTHP